MNQHHTKTLWLKEKKTSDDNLIPLINIVFLLLIFFMVAGQIQEQLTDDLQLPVNDDGTANPNLDYKIEMNSKKNWLFNQQPVDNKLLIQQLHGLTPNDTVSVLLHRELTAKQIQPLLNLLREQKVTDIRLISQSQE